MKQIDIDNIIGFILLYSSTSALYDLDANYLTYLSGRLEYRAGSSWVWDFSITQRKGTRKENNLEWTLGLSYKIANGAVVKADYQIKKNAAKVTTNQLNFGVGVWF